MKTLIPIILIASCLGGRAATVNGSFIPSGGTNLVTTVQCVPLTTPQVIGTNFIYSVNQTIRTSTNGSFSLVLIQGDYQVTVAGRDSVTISVPDTTNSLPFLDLISNTGQNYIYRTPGALVKVSTNDTTFGFLGWKMTNGVNIAITTLNSGSNEVLSIAATGVALSAHNHDATNVNSGTLDSARMPASIPLLTLGTLTAGAMRDVQGSLVHEGAVTLDFSTNTVNSLALTGGVTFATSGLAAGRRYHLLISATATNDALNFPPWRFVGPAPTNIIGAKIARLDLEAWGSDNTNVVARYWEEP